MAELQKGSKKLLDAWAFYDWANSVYTLTIASAVFPIFYEALFSDRDHYIDVFGLHLKNSALISFITAFAFLLVAFISPLLSGIADYVGNKKSFMKFFCYLGVLSCMGLYWFNLENIYIGLVFYFLGLIGYWGSLVFYNSYLPDIAFVEQQDKISAKGYAMGYIGSVILLIINLAMIMKPKFFGITGTEGEAAMKAMRYSFVMVGVWWILFSQYTYYFLPKGNKNANRKVSHHVVFNGFKELKKVWILLKENTALKRYLGSFFVSSMAVQTVMLVATYFGAQEIAWPSKAESTTGLIICILLIQLVAVVGAVLTSRASEKFGNIATLIVINCFWVLLCAGAFFITAPIQFYVMASLVGLVMGGIQALSRSTYSKLLPETEDTASFFSFYDVAEKIGIVIGMLVYGIIDQITGSPRLAIVFLGVFFVMAVFLLNRVPKKSVLN
ncbi:MAG: MFS transporter [Flavobacterium sp.]|jgi:UMF1 family MFS transporter|uniref:MFS transporter n=1 Tax=Flavobacterium sp. TaxID=239 RepID=UPI001B505889|nr:MFS transporter [Flavobacterium sp.]MBP6146462.1 MFS transporter [Flavobacterium sp.]MBP7182913.1 MFS transporter [Flavobacterium sp.]MBP7317318.1 MFS transporter [Flavobacterium sp.]MBP8886454.1 MFS transporter [Flavobacterium sp.]HRL70997.1 MFS transporter [Flavobacterium sp.]